MGIAIRMQLHDVLILYMLYIGQSVELAMAEMLLTKICILCLFVVALPSTILGQLATSISELYFCIFIIII